MKHIYRCALILVALLLLVPSLPAQTVPVIARVHEFVTLTSPDGAETETRLDGIMYRASDGTTLTVWLDAAGKPQTGELLDNRALGFFQIDYQRCTKHLAKKFSTSQAIRPVQPLTPAPQDTVAGLNCSIGPSWFVSRDGERRQSGTSCWSDDYALMLRSDSQYTTDGLHQTKLHTDLYDVLVNTEPPAAVFAEFENWSDAGACPAS